MNTLGKTGLKVFPIGFGGIVVQNVQPRHAEKIVTQAVEAGVNYFDVSPTYGDAEIKLADALKPFRKNVFLACKTTQRTAKEAKKELENSLKTLQTDYFDVYQLHALNDVEKDVKAAFAKNGAMKVILDAQKNGLVRNIGFTAHTSQAALAAINEFDFDTIGFPVNFCTHFNNALEVDVLKQAKKRNMGIIALKAIALKSWDSPEDKKKYPKCWYQPIDEPNIARLALSWSLQQGIAVSISPGEEKLLKLCISLLPQCKQLSQDQLEQLKTLAKKTKPIFSK